MPVTAFLERNTMKKMIGIFFASCLFFACGDKPPKLSVPSTGTNNTISIENIALKMIDIAGGDFVLGSKKSNDNKEHNVTLSDYQISETEITQELFETVMNYNPSEFKSETPAGEFQKLRPADRVNWYEAVEFCNKLTKTVMGENHCVYTLTNIERYKDENGIERATVTADWTKKGFRLPTEAEWEWAARCGDSYQYAGSNTLTEVAWCAANSKETHEVKKLKSNTFGLYDMTGNVWEWCWDLSGAIPDGIDLGKDPTGNTAGTFRVHRGACWFCPIPDTEGRYFVYFRDAFIQPDKKDSKIGFRIARYK